MREEVVGLEDDPDPAADPVHVDAARGDLLAVDDDAARVDRLEQVDAAQEGRLARAGGADQADDLVLRDVEVDPAQHLELAERLVETLDLDRAHAEASGQPLPPVAGDEPVGEARERDRDRHEEHRGDEVGGEVEVGRDLDLSLLERLDRAEDADERRVLLQADEVVQERRDHPPHGLRQHDRRSAWPRVSPSERAAASWLGCTDSIPAR